MDVIRLNNCEIKELSSTKIIGIGGTKRHVYSIVHTISGNYLSAVSINEAKMVARLLDLDYVISPFYECDYSE
jgi:hypothetical protein